MHLLCKHPFMSNGVRTCIDSTCSGSPQLPGSHQWWDPSVAVWVCGPYCTRPRPQLSSPQGDRATPTRSVACLKRRPLGSTSFFGPPFQHTTAPTSRLLLGCTIAWHGACQSHVTGHGCVIMSCHTRTRRRVNPSHTLTCVASGGPSHDKFLSTFGPY